MRIALGNDPLRFGVFTPLGGRAAPTSSGPPCGSVCAVAHVVRSDPASAGGLVGFRNDMAIVLERKL